MHIGEELKDIFHEQPGREGGRVPVVTISGWREIGQSLCSNKGTAASDELRWDVCRVLRNPKGGTDILAAPIRP